MEEKKLDEVLHDIQVKLKVPKSQRNKFGNYDYRSCEDILEAVKPLLPDGVSLVLDDEIILIGERYYIKSLATLFRTKGAGIQVAGYAREAETKKGMDESQITGAASSYARKYALNGLFGIDDTKDADHDNKHGKDTTESNSNSSDTTKKGATDNKKAEPRDKPAQCPKCSNKKAVKKSKFYEPDKKDSFEWYCYKKVDGCGHQWNVIAESAPGNDENPNNSAEFLIEQISSCKTREFFKSWWEQYQDSINKLRDNDPEGFNELLSVKADKMKEFDIKEKAELEF